eukprot:759653-Hanusia_phi.AAC.1
MSEWRGKERRGEDRRGERRSHRKVPQAKTSPVDERATLAGQSSAQGERKEEEEDLCESPALTAIIFSWLGNSTLSGMDSLPYRQVHEQMSRTK